MKFLIFDSGPLISLSITGLLPILKKINEKFPEIKMIITTKVKRETIDKAMSVKKYSFEGIELQDLIDKKILVQSSEFVKDDVLEKETRKILEMANSCLRVGDENLKIVQEGEASCLAFANLVKEQKLVVIDERVTRLLAESPQNLKAITEKKIHAGVSVDLKKIKNFQNFKFIRSSELLYLAYKNDLLEYKKNKIVLESALFALKYAGTSISTKEIKEIKEMR